MQQDRLTDAEQRNAAILKEVGSLREELDELRKSNGGLAKENLDMKDQVRVLN